MSEVIDRRIMGAVGFVEANSGLPINRPLQITCDEATFFRNRRGLYVITRAAGFADYGQVFDTPPAVTPRAITVQVVDPSGRYLPRQTQIDLPRDPDPANREAVTSLFQPVQIPLFLSPAAVPASGWALIYATVRHSTTQEPLGGALLRVIQNGSTVLARGLTVWQGRTIGEGLAAVPGLPVTISGDDGDTDGLVIVNEIPLTVEAVVDPAFDPDSGWPDPDDLETRRAVLPVGSVSVGLAAGRTAAVVIPVAF